MTNSVTFPENLGGNGKTYTDDTDPETGLDGLGYTVRFIPCLEQAVIMGLSAKDNAEAAASFAAQCQTLRNAVSADREAVANDLTHVNQQRAAADESAQQAQQAAQQLTAQIDSGLLDDTSTGALGWTSAKISGELERRVAITDIADTLTSDDPDKPLSARQGKTLKRFVDDHHHDYRYTGYLSQEFTRQSAARLGYTGVADSNQYHHIRGGSDSNSSSVSFYMALRRADELGARLPTIDELEANIAKGTGGGFDSMVCWTCTPVPGKPGYVYGAEGCQPSLRYELNTNGFDKAACRFVATLAASAGWANVYTRSQSEYRYAAKKPNVNAISSDVMMSCDITLSPGNLVAASRLYYSNASGHRLSSPRPTGTWQCKGRVVQGHGAAAKVALFMKVR